MLSPITSERKFRKINVYDLEWVPDTYELRIAGLYDGNRYQSFATLEGFLAHVLTSQYRGQWFYAHAGGLADVQFIFDTLVTNPAYSIEASFSGSSAIIVHVRRGKNVWHFIDSLWLLKGSLKAIGKSLGMCKTGPTDDMSEADRKEWYATIDYQILRRYNRNDCVVLWNALNEFEIAILDLGGQLQMTLASTGMHLFKRKYLGSEIGTSELINQKAVESYTASRVEVFESECYNARYFDINSSFPFAMTFPVPGTLIGNRRILSESFLADDNRPCLVLARVTVRDCYMPPLPYRVPGKIFFPVGSWESWFTGIDLRLLLETGGKIEYVKKVLEFEPRWDLKECSETLYKQRKSTDDPFHQMVYKLLMNSLYGKFAERREKRSMIINPDAAKFAAMKDKIARDNKKHGTSTTLHDYQLRPGVWLIPAVKYIPHRHVPVSAYITARARQTLFDYVSCMPDIHYCDTDGFSTTGNAETSDVIGGLKLEKIIEHGEFVRPKLYRLKGKEYRGGKWVEGTIVKAKGFSLSKTDNPSEMFDRLKRGQAVTVTGMYRIIENMRRGVTAPRDKEIEKLVKLDAVTKRFMYPDGQTRPWQVEEVKDMIK